MRAGGALALEKFFSNAFGNIFEAGILFDPEFDLPANQPGAAIPFNVCGEETITAVTGWDRTDAQLLLEVTSPGGAVIAATTAGLETAAGKTWTFLRIPLPFGGERNGKWSVRVVRPGGGGEFPPPTPALRYFMCRLLPPRATFMQDMNADERSAMQAHAAYWRVKLAEGAAIAFGPVADPAGGYGLGILAVPDEATLRAFQAADPAIVARIGLRYETTPMVTVVH